MLNKIMVYVLVFIFVFPTIKANAVENWDISLSEESKAFLRYVLSEDYYAKEVDWELFDRFVKYDLCIPDWGILSDEEQELCKYIFKTERSANNTVHCYKAREVFDSYYSNPKRLTLDVLDKVAALGDDERFYWLDWNIRKRYPLDISHEDVEFNVGEYRLDDLGNERILFYKEDFYSTEYYLIYVMYNDDTNEWDFKETFWFFADYNPNNLTFATYPKNKIIEDDNFLYYLVDNGTAVLRQIKDSNFDGKFIIPENIDGYTVTAIAERAFCESKVEKVVLPETIEVIYAYAFQHCENLKEINFPKSLRFMRYSVFENCTSLEKVEVDCPNLILGGTFMWCEGLKNAEIAVRKIDSNAFSDCQNLESVVIHSAEIINTGAFQSCVNLSKIILPDNLVTIGERAFGGDSYYASNNLNLTEIVIPQSVEIIGAIDKCSGSSMRPTSGRENPAIDTLILDPELICDPELTIKGYKNSETEKYAAENGLNFIAIDDVIYGKLYDGNNKVGIADLIILAKFISGKINLTDNQKLAADLNGDGKVDSDDLLIFIKYLIGEINKLPYKS